MTDRVVEAAIKRLAVFKQKCLLVRKIGQHSAAIYDAAYRCKEFQSVIQPFGIQFVYTDGIAEDDFAAREYGETIRKEGRKKGINVLIDLGYKHPELLDELYETATQI